MFTNIKGGKSMLKGKVAVITGGTRGIGYATVKKFLENGATVVLFGSRQETVDKALTSLKEENPDWPVSGAWPDLGNADAVAEEIGKIKETYGKIDILINNAGMSDSKPITDYTSDHFEKIMKLNVGAAMNCIMPTVKIMKEQGGGCILNTSSMVSICGQPSGVAYPVSKSAVNGMTWSLARELGPSNIRVNAVAPGITKTDMVAALPKEMIETEKDTNYTKPSNSSVILAITELLYIYDFSINGMTGPIISCNAHTNSLNVKFSIINQEQIINGINRTRAHLSLNKDITLFTDKVDLASNFKD